VAFTDRVLRDFALEGIRGNSGPFLLKPWSLYSLCAMARSGFARVTVHPGIPLSCVVLEMAWV